MYNVHSYMTIVVAASTPVAELSGQLQLLVVHVHVKLVQVTLTIDLNMPHTVT